MSDLSRITILLKTLLRDEHLYEAVAGIKATMPETTLLIIDDGDTRRSPKKEKFIQELFRAGDFYYKMAFDSGFGAKSNMAVWHMNQPDLTTPFLLIGSDDFDFRPPHVRWGIERMQATLDGAPAYSIASGWVNGVSYDYFIDEVEPGHFEECPLFRRPTPVQSVAGAQFQEVDLTVNYSLMRSGILGFGENQVHWDADVKIGGGEHGAFFLDVKRAGLKVAAVQGVNIAEQRGKQLDPRYGPMRRRARDAERPCFVRRGVRQWGSDFPKPETKILC